jgi:glycosyltransferase A (GT-A) superfamily protein (DUF2064 family)
MKTQILVLAKQPVPGRVKTRLCPPCTPEQAATVARAAIEDTLDAVDASRAAARVLVVDGHIPPRPDWTEVRQVNGGLDARLAHAFASTACGGWASLLIGMDTPQVTPELLDGAALVLEDADAAFGLAADGGWWALALRDPAHAQVLRDIPTSRPDTGVRTLKALQRRGLRVAMLRVLRDVDTAGDAWEVAAACPAGRFGEAVRHHVAAPAAVR